MTEQYYNDAYGTLSGSITSGSASFGLTAADPHLPSTLTAPFTVRIDDELIAVGAVTGTWAGGFTCGTLTRASELVGNTQTAAAHSAGATVEIIYSAGALRALSELDGPLAIGVANDDSAGLRLKSPSANHTGLIIEQAVSALADPFQIKDSAGDPVLRIWSNGDLLAHGPRIDVRLYGPAQDLRRVTDGAAVAGQTAQLDSATAAFVAGDVGKYVVINGAATPTVVTNNLTTTSGSAALTLVGASLTQNDVGKWIALPGAGVAGATLYTTIASVTGATTGTLATAASTSQAAVSQTVRYAGWLTTTITSILSATRAGLAAAIANPNLAGAPVAIATDDQPAIQAAVDDLVGSETLAFPSGNFFLASPLVVNKQISLVGLGISATYFWLPSGTGHGISVNQGQTQKIYGLHFDGFSILCLGDRTGGSALQIGNVGISTFTNLSTSNGGGGRPYVGVKVTQGSSIFFDKVRVNNCASHGWHLAPEAAGQSSVDLFLVDQVSSEGNLGSGIHIENGYANVGGNPNVQGVYVGACSVYSNYDYGLAIRVNNDVANIFLRGTILDSNRNSGLFVDGAGLVQSLRMQDIWISYNGNPNQVPSGALAHNMWLDANVRDWALNGGYIQRGGGAGITLWGNTRGRIQNCSIFDNNQGGISDYGVNVRSSASKIVITNNLIYNADWTLTYHQNGLTVEATCTDIDVFGNFYDTNRGGSGTTPRTIASGAGVREWGNVYDTASGNLVPFIDDGIAVTSRDVIALLNTLAATSGVPVQQSPGLRWGGYAWDGAVSRALDGREILIPVNGTNYGSRLARFFQKAGGGYTERASLDDLGNQYAHSYRDDQPRKWWVQQNTAAATLSTVGNVAVPTVTSAVAATAQENARGDWLRISATSNNAVASILWTAFTHARLDWDPVLVAKVEIPTALINRRIHIGLYSASPSGADSLATLSALGFRYSTGASDTVWQCIAANGVSQTVVSSGITVAADTVYVLKIDATDAANVRYYINNVLVAVLTATLPATTTNLGVGLTLTSLTASGQKDLDVGYASLATV